jgi:hypothetical protein
MTAARHTERDRRFGGKAVLMFVVFLPLACGSDSPAIGGKGSLSLKAVWQEGGTGEIAASLQTDSSACVPVSAPCTGLDSSGLGFGEEIPPAVVTIRVAIEPENGTPCCVSFARCEVSADERHLALTDLPNGSVRVTVSGFATTFAPNDGIEATCSVAADFPTMPCDPRPETPTFASETVEAQILEGARVDCGSLRTFALPFLIGRGTTADPVVDFTVVDAANAVDVESVSVELRQDDAVVPAGLETAPCSDVPDSSFLCSEPATDACGSEIESLEVTGLFTEAFPAAPLRSGGALVTVRAANSIGCELDFTYPVTIVATATATPTPTPTVSPTFTPTPTFTDSPTFTPSETPTPTETVSPTPTLLPNGSLCRLDVDCDSGFCADAFCCEGACERSEFSCDEPNQQFICDESCSQPGFEGRCLVVQPNFSSCTDLIQCASGFCDDGVCCPLDGCLFFQRP